MLLQKLLWHRKLRIALKKMRRRKRDIALALAFIVIPLILFLNQNKQPPAVASYKYCTPIDVVYTWVNGSDPAFIETAQRYDPAYDPARFDDKDELRFSLRSLELYAPWVRHVYIVTNGQIPHWLDLGYERVTVVPHDVLATHADHLPTFSSAAIETFLHRIPKLSQRFLYLNDDIFLGAPLYPEDLYTETEGVRIYQAWMVPDCAEDCPWTYIGDGACDRHCNIEACQYDGGDCTPTTGTSKSTADAGGGEQQRVVPKNSTLPNERRRFPQRRWRRRIPVGRNATSFKHVLQQQNYTSFNELRRIVDNYNSRVKTQPLAELAAVPPSAAAPTEWRYKSTHDVYSQSLSRTNMLLNRHYGFRPRNVLAHVGFLLERDIVAAMQRRFATEVYATSSHRFRSRDDLQFAFAYYSFVMSETRAASVDEIFDEFDTDGSRTWSDREVRTFLTRMYPLPLDWSAVRFFEDVVNNCSRDLGVDKRHVGAVHPTLVYERYEDSNLPTITRELVANCPLLKEALDANFALRPRYKFNLSSKRVVHNNFMMLTSNVSHVVDALDRMRRTPRKFNCINDNLLPQHTDENRMVRHLLEDFYLSFFPRRSKFELQREYRNRYSNWHDYQRWRRRKRAVLFVGYGASVILIVFLLRYLCIHKVKFARRYVQKL